MNDTVLQPKFIKPFSKGQITLPKDYRDYLGIDDKSWLKVFLWEDQILLVPVEEVQNQTQGSKRIKPKFGKAEEIKKEKPKKLEGLSFSRPTHKPII